MKKVKTCDICAFNVLLETCRGQSKICAKWIYYKYNCFRCKYIDHCRKLGKIVEDSYVCTNFALDKKEIEKKVEPIPVKKIISKSTVKKTRPESDEDTPVDIALRVVESNYNPQLFSKINENDIPWAKNDLLFLTGKKFLNLNLFPRQLVIFGDFLAAYCPYCSDTEYIRNKVEVDTPIGNIKDKMVLYINGVCKKCGKTRYDAIQEGLHSNYYQLIGCAGQRSGKSKSAAFLSALILHKYLKLSNPAKFFTKISSESLHGTFVGLTFNDAVSNLWAPFSNIINDDSNWFATYHNFLNEQQHHLGTELYRSRDTFITYNHKNLLFYPAGPDKRKLRGRTRILSIIDELGWFISSSISDGKSKIKIDPDEVYNSLDNSLMTVNSASAKLLQLYPDVPSAYGIYISSPSSKLDKIMRLYKSSIGSSKSYGFHSRSIDFNPDLDPEVLRQKQLEDPAVYERDFNANPSFSSNPFISSEAHVLDCFSSKSNVFKIKSINVTNDSLGKRLVYPKVSFNSVHSYPSCLSIDCGYNKNSFSLVLSHRRTDEENGERLFHSGIIEIVPSPYPISYPDVYNEVILKILNTFNVKLVVFDRWQSISLSQQIFNDTGIDAFLYSATYEDFNNYKSYVAANQVVCPKLENDHEDLMKLEKRIETLITNKPCSHLFIQMLASKDTGKVVTKGDETTDDILRAAVLGATMVIDYAREAFEGDGREASEFTMKLASKPAFSMTSGAIATTTVPRLGIVSSFGGINVIK